jgi:hypothetical protein
MPSLFSKRGLGGSRKLLGLLVLAIAAGAAIAIIALLTATGGNSGGRAAGLLTTNAYDFGTVTPGHDAAGAVGVRNSGARTVVVRTVRTSNPELTAQLSMRTLRPGQRGVLRLKFSSNTWDAELASTEWVLLYSNDPGTPLVKLAVHRRLEAPFTMEPKVPVLGPLRRDGKTLPLIQLRAKEGEVLGPLRPTSYVPFVQAKAIRGAGGSYRLTMKLSRAAPLGLLIGWINVATGNPRMPEVNLPIRTVVVNNVQVSPPQFDLGVAQEGKRAEADVSLIMRPGHPVRVLKVDPHLASPVNVVVIRHGTKGVLLKLMVPAAPSQRSLAGQLNVYTDDPAQPVIQIPVVGWTWARHHFMPGRAENLYSPLIAALFQVDDEKFSPTFIAQRILGGVPDDRAVSLLLRALKHENWYVRQRAADVLGVVKTRLAIGPLRSAVIGDIDEDVRSSSAKALAKIAGRQAVPDLVLAILDNDAGVRETAATWLGRLGDRRAIPALTAAQADSDSSVKLAARGALKKLRVGG